MWYAAMYILKGILKKSQMHLQETHLQETAEGLKIIMFINI